MPRWALALGLTVFVVGFFLALQSVSLTWSQFELPWLLIAALVGVPMMTVLNALEYKLTGRLLGRSVPAWEAVEVAVTSTAANLLPVPGGPFLKIASLRRTGAPTRSAAHATVWSGMLWLNTAVLVAAVTLMSTGRGLYVVAAGGACMLGIAALVMLKRLSHEARPWPALAALVTVEFGSTLATALRLWLIGQGIGISVGSTALVLSLAPVLGAAVVFLPAGLGVREAAAAGLAAISGAEAGVGYLLTAVDRIIGLVVHGVAAAILVGRRTRTSTR
jgi:uncharacterized membrane protein YbhN (UPF0104 family)